MPHPQLLGARIRRLHLLRDEHDEERRAGERRAVHRRDAFAQRALVARLHHAHFQVDAVAGAGEVTGKIQAVDSAERVITLEDGTKLWIAEGVSIDNLKEGARVKASYEERDGKNVVTTIEVDDK